MLFFYLFITLKWGDFMWVKYSNNPYGLNGSIDDCVVRALSVLLDQTWDETYTNLALLGIAQGKMPSNNAVHISYLKQHGYKMHIPSSDCPDCITVREFSERYPNGDYFLACGDHVVALIQGNYYDVFDSGDEVIVYYFSK